MKVFLQQPMQSVLWPQRAHLLINSLLVLAASLLLAAASQIAIPWQPVPLTLQTFAVLFLGMGLGWRLGSISVLFYLMMGAVGLPVFSGLTSGTSILFGATSGYLFGFIFAAAISGWLIERGWGKNFWTVILSALVGEIVIFGCGLLVLNNYFGWKTALITGFGPFVSGELIKMTVLAMIIPSLWRHR